MSEKIFKIEMNAEVKDNISGFTGTVTGRAEYITGCRQYVVQPKMKKGDKTYPEAQWLDEGRLLDSVKTTSSSRKGGPQRNPAPIK